nr:hypothetical protein [Tanacetum cinerariifolium]
MWLDSVGLDVLMDFEMDNRECYNSVARWAGGFVETSTRSFLVPFLDDPYVEARNDAMADDDVEDDDVEDDDDMDDDAANPSDPQSFESRGSPRNSQYTYEQGESSSAREILKNIGEVYLFSLVSFTIGTSMMHIKRLNEQILKRAEIDERIVKKIHRSDLGIHMVGRDAMSLDGAVRECQANVSKVISMMESMSLEFDRVRKQSRRALELVE